MASIRSRAVDLHKNVPPDWYARSIKENVLQRFWHTTRFEEIGRMIESAGGKILDIGSADGTFSKIILDSSKADIVVGIDVLPQSVVYAKKRFARSKKMSFRVADAHELPFKDKEFNAVFCLETLEHVENPGKVVAEMNRVLRDNGYILVLVPAENWLFRYIVWPLWTLSRGKIWKGTHLNQFTGDQVLQVIENQGFKIVENKKFLLGMLQAAKAVKKI